MCTQARQLLPPLLEIRLDISLRTGTPVAADRERFRAAREGNLSRPPEGYTWIGTVVYSSLDSMRAQHDSFHNRSFLARFDDEPSIFGTLTVQSAELVIYDYTVIRAS